MCVPGCPAGQYSYENETHYSCIYCDSRCGHCIFNYSTKATDCLTCEDDPNIFYFNYDGIKACMHLSQIPPGYYGNL